MPDDSPKPDNATKRWSESSLQRLVMPGVDFCEFALRALVIQGAEFTVKTARGEMRIDGGIRRLLQLLDAERQRHNHQAKQQQVLDCVNQHA